MGKTEYDTTLIISSFCVIDHGLREIHLFAGSILDCSLYIPPNSEGTIFSFVNLSGENNAALEGRIQRTCFLMSQQLVFLRDIDNKIEVHFFLCLPPTIDDKIVSSKFQGFADEQKRMSNVDWQIVTLKLEKGHIFPEPAIQTVKSTLKPLYGISSEFSKKFESFVPTEWTFNFSLATFTESLNEDDKLAIKLDKEGVKKFVDRYFPARCKNLITLPEFDRIKCTKLYPKQNSKDERVFFPEAKWEFSVFNYIGEIEKFWPQFHSWMQNPKGLLLHSYSMKELAPLLETENLFSFEFDWIYFSPERVAIVEVAMCDKLNKPKEMIKRKIKQILNHTVTLKLIVWNVLNRRETISMRNELFDRFFQQKFTFIVFFANIDNGKLSNWLEGALANLKNSFSEEKSTFSHFVKKSNCIFFVGQADSFNKNEPPFYKYDNATEKMVSSPIENYPEMEENNRFFIEDIMGVFALGYFCQKHSELIINGEQSPAPLAIRYRNCQREFLDKFQRFRKDDQKFDPSFIDKLDVILSPQQFGILFANPKILFCMGESGSGKTELLLAKALQSALDDDVDRVYFCIPSKKGERERSLWTFVKQFRDRHSNEFDNKFEIISYKTLVDEGFIQQLPKDLRKVVLLVDEFHYRYDQNFQIEPKKFLQTSLRIGPYLKHFWFATITLKWYEGMRKVIKTYVPLEFLSAKPLNVQYRSAEHIGMFCTNLVNVDRLGRFSSSRVHGVYKSGAQEKVAVFFFPKDVQQSENSMTQNCSWKKDFEPKKGLCSKYEKNRWIIVVCKDANIYAWEKYIKDELLVKNGSQEFFIISLKNGPPGCYFSGGEVQSVVLFVDGPSSDEYKKEKDKFDDIFLLACSRAQYELTIFVREDLSHVYDTFRKCTETVYEDRSALSQDKSTLIAQFLSKLETTTFSAEDVTSYFKPHLASEEFIFLKKLLTNRDPKIIRSNVLYLGITLAVNVFDVLLSSSLGRKNGRTQADKILRSKQKKFDSVQFFFELWP